MSAFEARSLSKTLKHFAMAALPGARFIFREGDCVSLLENVEKASRRRAWPEGDAKARSKETEASNGSRLDVNCTSTAPLSNLQSVLCVRRSAGKRAAPSTP